MTIRAMLFDLDNTLYPASSGVMQHIDRRIGEYVQQHLRLSEAEAAEIKRHYYTTYGTTLRGLQQHYGLVETDEYLRFVHDIAIEELLKLDAELDATLARIPARKVIFTNSPREHAERVLKAMELSHHFEQIFDLRYFNFVAKPDPECYQHILDVLGVDASESLLLEDTPHNLPPAKALGMTTLLISDTIRECGDADYIVEDIQSALVVAEGLVAPRLALLTGKRQRPRASARLRRSA